MAILPVLLPAVKDENHLLFIVASGWLLSRKTGEITVKSYYVPEGLKTPNFDDIIYGLIFFAPFIWDCPGFSCGAGRGARIPLWTTPCCLCKWRGCA